MAIFDNSGSQASQHNSSVPPRKAPFKKGDFIGKYYEVFDVLGEGGFGIVYLVYSHETKSAYALKTFRDEYLKDTKIRERFKREAQVWIDLERHPYLVRASFVEEISGRLFIAMEHIASDEPGMNTLDGFLRCGPPDLAQSLRWAIQFCHGMEYAYSKGVKAHRDIKPANIMIDQSKAVKITDFGLACVLIESSVSEQGHVAGKVGNDSLMQTAIGTSIGTPEYMPPEQFTDLSACDERSDIYSFGIVLYQMASGGKLPFYTENPDYRWTALKHFHHEAPVPKLNSPLFPVIQRCLEKEPQKRYQSFKDLRADLEPLLKRETGEIVKLPERVEVKAGEWNNRGASLDNLGKSHEAVICYNHALKIDIMNGVAWMNKGNAFANLGKNNDATACYDRALAINPSYPRAWSNKGVSLRKLGKYEEAIDCYNRALGIDPQDEETWMNKGNALYDRGNYKEAVDCYEMALRINPKVSKVWYNKGNILIELLQADEALRCYDKALEIDPFYFEAWYGKGVALHSIGKDQEAIACYDRAIEINPRDAGALLNKGGALISLCRYQEAIDCCEQTLSINSKKAFAWSFKGIALAKLGKHQEAIVCFDMFLEIDPRNDFVWFRKGLSLDELGKDREAMACFNKTLEINPKHADAWMLKGTYFGDSKEYKDAIICYDRVLEIDPNHFVAWYNKGFALLNLGKHKETIACYNKVLEIEPQNAVAWHNKGESFKALGMYKEAIEAFKNFIRYVTPKHVGRVEKVKEIIKQLERIAS